jgi:hypothetical protein
MMRSGIRQNFMLALAFAARKAGAADKNFPIDCFYSNFETYGSSVLGGTAGVVEVDGLSLINGIDAEANGSKLTENH